MKVGHWILSCVVSDSLILRYENQTALSGSLDTRPMALGFRFAQCTPDVTKVNTSSF